MDLITRICQNKKVLHGSTLQNYTELKVLPVTILYEQFAILFSTADINKQNELKRDIRAYGHIDLIHKKGFWKTFY